MRIHHFSGVLQFQETGNNNDMHFKANPSTRCSIIPFLQNACSRQLSTSIRPNINPSKSPIKHCSTRVDFKHDAHIQPDFVSVVQYYSYPMRTEPSHQFVGFVSQKEDANVFGNSRLTPVWVDFLRVLPGHLQSGFWIDNCESGVFK